MGTKVCVNGFIVNVPLTVSLKVENVTRLFIPASKGVEKATVVVNAVIEIITH